LAKIERNRNEGDKDYPKDKFLLTETWLLGEEDNESQTWKMSCKAKGEINPKEVRCGAKGECSRRVINQEFGGKSVSRSARALGNHKGRRLGIDFIERSQGKIGAEKFIRTKEKTKNVQTQRAVLRRDLITD